MSMSKLKVKEELGEILTPWEFSSSQENIEVGDSITALNKFRAKFGGDGPVSLILITLANLNKTELLAWHYRINDKSIIQPVFSVDDTNAFNNFAIKEIKHVTSGIYYYLNRILYAAIFTTTGNIVIKKVRSVLSETDMHNILRLRGTEYTDVYPVDIYSYDLKRFVGACWAIENAENRCIHFEPICRDESEKLFALNIENIEPIPIEINGEVDIGGDTFILRYKNNFGKYFEKSLSKKKLRESIEQQKASHNNIAPTISFCSCTVISPPSTPPKTVEEENSAPEPKEAKILNVNFKKWQ